MEGIERIQSTKYYEQGFKGKKFQSFIQSFFEKNFSENEGKTMDDIYRAIFGNHEVYSRFLQACKESNFWFVEGNDVRNYKKNSILLSFEQVFLHLEENIKDKVYAALDSKVDVLNLAFVAENIPGTNITYFFAQSAAVDKGIMLNEKGEILYHIRDIPKGENIEEYFQVFSFGSGNHLVDKAGNIINMVEEEKRRRIVIRKEVDEYIEVQQVLEKESLSIRESILLQKIQRKFCAYQDLIQQRQGEYKKNQYSIAQKLRKEKRTRKTENGIVYLHEWIDIESIEDKPVEYPKYIWQGTLSEKENFSSWMRNIIGELEREFDYLQSVDGTYAALSIVK